MRMPWLTQADAFDEVPGSVSGLIADFPEAVEVAELGETSGDAC
jgi:hypothetical protein